MFQLKQKQTATLSSQSARFRIILLGLSAFTLLGLFILGINYSVAAAGVPDLGSQLCRAARKYPTHAKYGGSAVDT